MPELLTLAVAKDSLELKEVSGTCSNSAAFLSLLNEATRKLLTRGNWASTVEKIGVCIHNNCLTWPKSVGTILAVNAGRQWVMPQNYWFSFLPLNMSDWGVGGFRFLGAGSCGGNAAIEPNGYSSVFNNVPCGKTRYVRAYPASRSDIGKTITIFGVDFNGQVIRTQATDGTWSEGVTLTLVVPFASTPFQVQRIDRVRKDVTQNLVRLFLYDADNNLLENCAEYDPQDKNPSFLQSKLLHVPTCCNECNGVRNIEALVKLQFIPVVNDTDVVLISNLGALADMMMACRDKKSGDPRGAIAMESSAIRELNLEKRQVMPLDQIPIDINPWGRAMPVYHGVGRIV